MIKSTMPYEITVETFLTNAATIISKIKDNHNKEYVFNSMYEVASELNINVIEAGKRMDSTLMIFSVYSLGIDTIVALKEHGQISNEEIKRRILTDLSIEYSFYSQQEGYMRLVQAYEEFWAEVKIQYRNHNVMNAAQRRGLISIAVTATKLVHFLLSKVNSGEADEKRHAKKME